MAQRTKVSGCISLEFSIVSDGNYTCKLNILQSFKKGLTVQKTYVFSYQIRYQEP